MPHLFCFGLSYSALSLAAPLLSAGWRVSGTTRSGEKAETLTEQGIAGFHFDGTRPMAQGREVLREATHILLSAPPDAEGDPVLRHHIEDLTSSSERIRWIGYLSTIGVYGDRQGAWIDESTHPAPIHPDSAARLAAERAWLDLGEAAAIPVQVFRLAGIYGPGRSQIEALREGRAHRIVKTGQVFNRIHVDDLAAVLMASMEQPAAGRIYNVCDDEPAPAQDVVAFAANLLDIVPPPEIPIEKAGLPPFAMSFYAECKRVRNDRIRDELGLTLAYPSYREGLAAILEKTKVRA
jgi:nucleoside-diphosphate-sugar epimerase